MSRTESLTTLNSLFLYLSHSSGAIRIGYPMVKKKIARVRPGTDYIRLIFAVGRRTLSRKSTARRPIIKRIAGQQAYPTSSVIADESCGESPEATAPHVIEDAYHAAA